MDQAEASGRTVDDALNRALAKLGATRNDVDNERVEFRVLDEGRKGGLFGRGAKDATVAVWWAGQEAANGSQAHATAPAVAPAPARPERSGQRPPRQPAAPSASGAGAAADEDARARRRGGRGRGGRNGDRPAGQGGESRGAGGRQSYDAAVPKLTDADFQRPRFDGAPAEAPSPAPRPERDRGDRGGRPSRPSEARQGPPPERRQRSERRRPEEGPQVEPNIDAPEVDFAAQTVDDLLRIFGIDAEISIREPVTPGDGLGSAFAVIDIKGEDLGVLIGRRGDTLIAMQYLVNLILSRRYPGQGGVTLDVEHYRHRNEERIIALARRMADRVRETGSSITLEPMSPAERRLIHLAFIDDPDLETNSVGEGEHRKVVISRR